MALVTCTNHYDKNEHYTTYQKSDMYVFNALPAGTYEIYASKDGYKNSVLHTLTILNNDFVDLNLDLRELDIDYGTINGRVLSQGVGLSSATVNIQGPSATNLTVVTRLDGNFTANVKPGNYNITITFEGYVTQSNTVNVTLGNISVINFTMEKVPPTLHGDSDSPTWNLILVLGSLVLVIIIVVSVAFAYRAGKRAKAQTKSGQTCPKCGLLVDDGLEKCPNCGRNLQAKTFRCPDCGTELEVGAKKCPTCGCKNFEFKESEESDNAVRKEGSVFGNIDYDDEVEEE
jgi:RNA polymerase subunit RPABC4/transcription elongation factor Spt4